MPDSDRRAALLGQLRYLTGEAEMLRLVIDRVPEALQQARALEGSLSLKETLALVAGLDARVRQPHLDALRTGSAAPALPERAELIAGAHDRAAAALLDDLVANREKLVATAEALRPAEWAAVEAYLYDVTQQDADLLRTLTQQLFDAQGLGR